MLQLLSDLITVSRANFGSGASFGVTTSPTNVYTSIAAAVYPVSPSVALFYNQRNIVITTEIYLNQSLTLQVGDTVSDGTNTYKVRGWVDMKGLGRAFRVDCEYFVPAS